MFSTADTIQSAEDCIALVDAAPDGRHDPFTVRFMGQFRGDLEALTDTGECSERLAEEVATIKWVALDESVGEATTAPSTS